MGSKEYNKLVNIIKRSRPTEAENKLVRLPVGRGK